MKPANFFQVLVNKPMFLNMGHQLAIQREMMFEDFSAADAEQTLDRIVQIITDSDEPDTAKLNYIRAIVDYYYSVVEDDMEAN